MTRQRAGRHVAIVGVGTTDYGRDLGRSRGDLALEACRRALADAGLGSADVDGLSGNPTQASPQYVQGGLGIPALHWWSTPPIPFSLLLVDAVNAVFAGACTTAVVYQSQVRGAPGPPRAPDPHLSNQFYAPYGGRSAGYAGYMRHYMHRYGASREHFGMVSVSARAHGAANPHAALQDPISLDDYLAARMVRDPMCLFDFDYAVDGADAVVVTTTERAVDLVETPVLVDAYAYGSASPADEDLWVDLASTGQPIAADELWRRTDLGRNNVDLLLPYDGFTMLTLFWLEALGWCAPGEGASFVERHWNRATGRLVLPGDVPVNPHGGSLSEGATQGAGHVREAVHQLQGEAGDRQVPGASVALLGVGGLFLNATALLLTTD